jgi:hypothetical protein
VGASELMVRAYSAWAAALKPCSGADGGTRGERCNRDKPTLMRYFIAGEGVPNQSRLVSIAMLTT